MTIKEQLRESDGDLDQLIHRVECALPTLRRAVEDVTDWRKDIRKELLSNLEQAVKRARDNQQKRRRDPETGADHMLDRFLKKGLAAQRGVDETLGRVASQSEGDNDPAKH